MFRRLLKSGLSAAERSSTTARARHRPFITPRARYHQTKRLSQRDSASSSTSTSIPSFKKRPKRIMELSTETRDELNAEVGYDKYGLTLSEDDVFCPIENPKTAKWDLARSWTGNEIIRLQVTAPRFRTSGPPSATEAKVEREGENQDARVTEITWETAQNIC